MDMDYERQQLLEQIRALTKKIETFNKERGRSYVELRESVEEMNRIVKMYALGPSGSTCPTCGGSGRI